MKYIQASKFIHFMPKFVFQLEMVIMFWIKFLEYKISVLRQLKEFKLFVVFSVYFLFYFHKSANYQSFQ